MKIQEPFCARCGLPVSGTNERVEGLAQAEHLGEGVLEYTGQTDVDWDSQRNVSQHPGHVSVSCDNGHSWLAHVSEA